MSTFFFPHAVPARFREVVDDIVECELIIDGIESGNQMKEYLALINPELKNVKCDIAPPHPVPFV